MKIRLLSLAALLVMVTFAGGQGEVKNDEKAKIQGTWAVESVIADGKEVPSDVVKVIRMTFKGDGYVVAIGQEKTEGTITLDATKNPKWIDILPENGPDRGRKQLGVYEFRGDKLHIFAAQPGKDRPTTFETKDRTGYTLLVLRKAN